MIRKFYVHNFRCLVNFELDLTELPTVLIVGRNGCGKSSVRDALRALQVLARGQSRFEDVVPPSELSLLTKDNAVRFELEAQIGPEQVGNFKLALERPHGERQFLVMTESLSVGDRTLYERRQEEVRLHAVSQSPSVVFPLDQRHLAMPALEVVSEHPLTRFREWLSNVLILSPVPQLVWGESIAESSHPSPDMSDFASWYRALTVQYPVAGGKIQELLKGVWPDLYSMVNAPTGRESKSFEFLFQTSDKTTFTVPLGDLSDGEKCLAIWATVLAWAEVAGPSVCFWDEPDNYLSTSEVGQMVMGLRKSFGSYGQLIVTSHNPEAIGMFSRENTVLLRRSSHSAPTRPPTRAADLDIKGDLSEILARGEVA